MGYPDGPKMPPKFYTLVQPWDSMGGATMPEVYPDATLVHCLALPPPQSLPHSPLFRSLHPPLFHLSPLSVAPSPLIPVRLACFFP